MAMAIVFVVTVRHGVCNVLMCPVASSHICVLNLQVPLGEAAHSCHDIGIVSVRTTVNRHHGQEETKKVNTIGY